MRITMRMAMTMALVVSMAINASAKKKPKDAEQGTSAKEIATLKLPQPPTIKVAILPFWDVNSEPLNIRAASAATYLYFEHEGFQMVPIKDSFKATGDDNAKEPGLALRGSDALRIGEAVGADWVVYGEIKELEKHDKHSFWVGTKSWMNAGMRIAIADTHTGKIFYWKSRSNDYARGDKKYDSSVRASLMAVIRLIVTPLFDALPEHATKPGKVGTGDVAKFTDENWPK